MALFGDSGAAGDYRNMAILGMQGQMDYLNQAKQPIQQAYQQGTAAWNPLVNPTLGGFNAYADITGAQGQAGQDRARALFQTDPGYQFALNQGLQATQRATGTGGFQGSGNVADALMRQGVGYANQQYNQYVQRLAPYLQLAPQVAGAQTNLAQWQGGNLANILGTQGNVWGNTANAIGQSQAAADIANQNANNQFWGGVANLGTKLLGFGGPNAFNFGGSGAGATGGGGSAGGFGGGGGGSFFSQLFGTGGRTG